MSVNIQNLTTSIYTPTLIKTVNSIHPIPRITYQMKHSITPQSHEKQLLSI